MCASRRSRRHRARQAARHLVPRSELVTATFELGYNPALRRPLGPGARLGPYEIIAAIGAGRRRTGGHQQDSRTTPAADSTSDGASMRAARWIVAPLLTAIASALVGWTVRSTSRSDARAILVLAARTKAVSSSPTLTCCFAEPASFGFGIWTLGFGIFSRRNSP
jgi:hypothetical protein